MKKLFFLMPLAALVFASCSNDEVQSQAVKQSTDVVTFLPAMNNVTRGTIFTDAGFKTTPGTFKVIINGKFYAVDPSLPENSSATAGTVNATHTVTYNTSAWELSPSLWWGDGTTAATFTAYAPQDAGTVSSGNLSFNVASTVGNQKDLVVAYNKGNRSDFSSGVPLHFRHALSQILVNASYADDASFPSFPTLDVKIKAIRFSNVYGSGTLTLPTASTAAGETYAPAWTTSGSATQFGSTELTTALSLTSTAQYIVTSSDPMLLMPQTTAATTDLSVASPTGAYLEVLASITKKDGGAAVYPATAGDYEWIAVPVAISWDGGYKYTYTLNFSNVACGKVSPNATNPTPKAIGDDVISGVPYPVTFLVTVEDTWTDGGTTTPAL